MNSSAAGLRELYHKNSLKTTLLFRGVSRFPLRLAFDHGLRRGQAGDGDAEGRAGDVVQAGAVAELDAGGVAAVFAADAAFETFLRFPALGDRHFHELSDSGLIPC